MCSRIAIVTPSFGQAEFLPQALESVLSQAGDFYIDYYIADAGSDDGSVEIIKKYAKLLERGDYPVRCLGIDFKWRSFPDQGQTQALNEGFQRTQGEICAWLNSDDYYEKDAFQKITNEFKHNPDVHLVYGNCYDL